jgi:hypothetical protein
MLRNWNHPLAEHEDYRHQMLETAADVLSAAARGTSAQVFIEGVPAADMSFVAALWYAENRAIEDAQSVTQTELDARRSWLDSVRRTLPSCFCSQDSLP